LPAGLWVDRETSTRSLLARSSVLLRVFSRGDWRRPGRGAPDGMDSTGGQAPGTEWSARKLEQNRKEDLSQTMTPEPRFRDRVALIAGGTGALGRAVSWAFAREAARVIVTYRRQPEFEAFISQAKGHGE